MRISEIMSPFIWRKLTGLIIKLFGDALFVENKPSNWL